MLRSGRKYPQNQKAGLMCLVASRAEIFRMMNPGKSRAISFARAHYTIAARREHHHGSRPFAFRDSY